MPRHAIASPTTRKRRRSNGRILSQVADILQVPGFVNSHCHAFQRGLRGTTEGRDFWTWRDAMMQLARGLPPSHIRHMYTAVYDELLGAGYTAVGEFHYLGRDEALAAAEAASDAGIVIVVLYVAYGRGGIDRFRQDSRAQGLAEVEPAGRSRQVPSGQRRAVPVRAGVAARPRATRRRPAALGARMPARLSRAARR